LCKQGESIGKVIKGNLSLISIDLIHTNNRLKGLFREKKEEPRGRPKWGSVAKFAKHGAREYIGRIFGRLSQIVAG
jgi:hypothetical protein